MSISVEAMALCIYAKKWEIWDTYFWLALKYPTCGHRPSSWGLTRSTLDTGFTRLPGPLENFGCMRGGP